MSRKNGKGGLYSQNVKDILNKVVPRLNDARIKYWLFGGVLEDIIELGEIAGPHGDIDFFIAPEAVVDITRLLDVYAKQRNLHVDIQSNEGSTIKLQYSGSLTIEFLILHNKDDDNFQTATTTTGPNWKSFPKIYIGDGVAKTLSGLDQEIWIPSCPRELLDALK